MALVQHGHTVRAGDEIPRDPALPARASLMLINVNKDGSRKARSYEGPNPEIGSTVFSMRLSSRDTTEPLETIPANRDGWIAFIQGPGINETRLTLGLPQWVPFPVSSTTPIEYFSRIPVTPADDFYRFRRILAEHAFRFKVEHRPENLRLEDPDIERIEHLAHELSALNRIKAGNTSKYHRELFGYLWERIHKIFRPMDPQNPTVWKAERDRLDILFDHLCELCAGSGISGRTMKHAPDAVWSRLMDAGVRFDSDRDFNIEVLSEAGIMTPAVARNNRVNYVRAVDHFEMGDAQDDDYLEPRTGYDESPDTPVMPELDTLQQAELAATWRQRYDSCPDEDKPNYRKFIVTQLVAVLHPQNSPDNLDLNTSYRFNMQYVVPEWYTRRFDALFAYLKTMNPWTGVWNLNPFRYYHPQHVLLQVRGDIFMGQGHDPDTQVDPLIAWDTDRREEVFDKIDAILGDRTPERPEPTP